MKPKIGIRPTTDGRWGGIRENLEAKTMAMAEAAKETTIPWENKKRYPYLNLIIPIP